jgi:hypothetical protein
MSFLERVIRSSELGVIKRALDEHRRNHPADCSCLKNDSGEMGEILHRRLLCKNTKSAVFYDHPTLSYKFFFFTPDGKEPQEDDYSDMPELVDFSAVEVNKQVVDILVAFVHVFSSLPHVTQDLIPSLLHHQTNHCPHVSSWQEPLRWNS